jgi:hypothetical protein
MRSEAIEPCVRSSILNSTGAIARYLQTQKNDAGLGNLVCWMTLSMPSLAGIALALYALSMYSAALLSVPRRIHGLFKIFSLHR